MLSVILENNRHCSVCKVKYPSSQSLLRHYRSHFPEQEKHIKCEHCNLVFTKKDNVARHMRVQHGIVQDGESSGLDEEETMPCEAPSDGDSFTCQFCSEDFTNKDSLRLHMIRSHKVSKAHLDSQNDTQSVTSHSDSDSQPSNFEACTCHCGRYFLRNFDYRQHVRQQHKTELTYFEHECSDLNSFEKFKRSNSLKHNLRFVEEATSSKTIGYFKCKEDEDSLSGTCTASLSVFANGTGYLISGIITHSNHEMSLSNQPELNVVKAPTQIAQSEKLSPTKTPVVDVEQLEKVGPELLKDLFGVKKPKIHKPVYPTSSEALRSNISSLNLKFPNPAVNKKKALNGSFDEPKAKSSKLSLDLFNVGSSSEPKTQSSSVTPSKQKSISMSLFDLGVNKNGRNKSSSSSSGTPTRKLSSDISDKNAGNSCDDSNGFGHADITDNSKSGQVKVSPKPLDLLNLGFKKLNKKQPKSALENKPNAGKMSLELFNL